MKSGWRWALIAMVSVAAVWTGLDLSQRIGRPPLSAVSPPTPSSEPALLEPEIAPQPGIRPATSIPAQLPAFLLKDLQGRPTSAARWQGKSLMINFWATWCAPCRREIPLLQSLHGEFGGEEFEVIGIAVDFPDKVRSFRDQFGITYPLLVGEQEALDLISRLGVATPAFPFTVFTDRQGRVVTLYLGELKRPVVAAILAAVKDVDQGRLDLPAAQARIESEVRALRKESRTG